MLSDLETSQPHYIPGYSMNATDVQLISFIKKKNIFLSATPDIVLSTNIALVTRSVRILANFLSIHVRVIRKKYYYPIVSLMITT